MSLAHVKNWAEFQHYKDRSPPWIKLHRAILDDFKFSSLPLASKALAPLIWLLAAETQDGSFEADADYLAFRLRWRVQDVTVGLSALFEKGFLIPASGVLAPCKQVATPETEGETEREKDFAQQAAQFEVFWKAYPNKKGRTQAEKFWKRDKLTPLLPTLLADVAARKRSDPDWLRGAIPYGSTYLNQSRWRDELAADALPASSPASNPGGVSPRLSPEEEARRKVEALAEMRRQYPEMNL